MPSFLFFFFYVGVCSIICVRRKTGVLSLVVGVFFWINCRHTKCKCESKVLAPKSETKPQKERKNLRKHLRSQKREKINRGKSEFWFKKNSKTSPQFLSSRWSGF